MQFYVDLVRSYGAAGRGDSRASPSASTQFGQGQAAMWYDATSMVGTVEDPADVDRRRARSATRRPRSWRRPTRRAGCTPGRSASRRPRQHKDEAWEFMSWMTNKEYIELVGEELGWDRGAAGQPAVDLRDPAVRSRCRGAYADADLQRDAAGEPAAADRAAGALPGHPVRRHPRVPGPRHPREPADVSAAIAGQITVDEALEQSQSYAETVGETYQERVTATVGRRTLRTSRPTSAARR